MRIALILLFLLSLAAVPGSILPQEPVNPATVTQFLATHRFWGPILQKVDGFNVFESPWFAAIYLLLFISLIGCIVPRTLSHIRAMRTPPPRAPRNLDRLPVHREWAVAAEAGVGTEDVQRAAAARLKRKWYRVSTGTDRHGGYVAAEKGYLREIGNLLFHLSLLGILTAVALGHFYGYKGAAIVTEGTPFANTLTDYNDFTPGGSFNAAGLAPFSLTLNQFAATYSTAADQYGQPLTYDAHVTYRSSISSPSKNYDIQVNHPLNVDGAKVFLAGHGYAPVIILRNAKGDIVYDDAATYFLDAADGGNQTSSGIVKVPDGLPQQLGLVGILYPDAVMTSGGMTSGFPAAQNPELVLNAWTGDLGLNDGQSQNVYQLDTTHMTQVRLGGTTNTAKILTLGQTYQLPNGLGSVTFAGVKNWVQFNIAYDPGKNLALYSAIAAILGLIMSLGLRRRRVWIRIRPSDDGSTHVAIAGLARTESAYLVNEVRDLNKQLRRDVRALVGSRASEPAQPEPELTIND
jgi:cytochrome c biogenesis protein